jgi:hypothetical protein
MIEFIEATSAGLAAGTAVVVCVGVGEGAVGGEVCAFVVMANRIVIAISENIRKLALAKTETVVMRNLREWVI